MATTTLPEVEVNKITMEDLFIHLDEEEEASDENEGVVDLAEMDENTPLSGRRKKEDMDTLQFCKK